MTDATPPVDTTHNRLWWTPLFNEEAHVDSVSYRFAEDFIAFQRSLRPVKRNATGDDGTPYADIEAIWTYIRPRLAKHGFAIVQWEGVGTITTRLIHKSGLAIEDMVTTDSSASGPTRYGRRHALMCLLGLVEAPIPPKPDSNNIDIQPYGMLAEAVGIALLPLSIAQRLVLVRKYPADGVALIAEAKKLGGAK